MFQACQGHERPERALSDLAGRSAQAWSAMAHRRHRLALLSASVRSGKAREAGKAQCFDMLCRGVAHTAGLPTVSHMPQEDDTYITGCQGCLLCLSNPSCAHVCHSW